MLGLTFEVIPSAVSEEVLPLESPEEHALRLARAKARDVSQARGDSMVLGGDTVVVLDGEVLGKPTSPKEAVTMLSRLGGRSHVVISGLALALPDGRVLAGTDRTEVRFRPIHPDQARRYVDTGEPMDKAGAYGIQGRGGALVERVNGDYFTVVGLPLSLLMDLLEEAGWRYQFGELVSTARGTD